MPFVSEATTPEGRPRQPADAYRRALALVHDDAERRLLERRLAELGAGA